MKTSGLSELRREAARQSAMRAAYAALANKALLHYTQDNRRWEPINFRIAGWRGDSPAHADCSSFATWVIWCGLRPFGVGDVCNGRRWRSGFTGTLYDHGIAVTPGMEKRADLVFYGDVNSSSGHVAVSVGGDLVISFGSEPGPFKLDRLYRGDYVGSRRYI